MEDGGDMKTDWYSVDCKSCWLPASLIPASIIIIIFLPQVIVIATVIVILQYCHRHRHHCHQGTQMALFQPTFFRFRSKHWFHFIGNEDDVDHLVRCQCFIISNPSYPRHFESCIDSSKNYGWSPNELNSIQISTQNGYFKIQ